MMKTLASAIGFAALLAAPTFASAQTGEILPADSGIVAVEDPAQDTALQTDTAPQADTLQAAEPAAEPATTTAAPVEAAPVVVTPVVVPVIVEEPEEPVGEYDGRWVGALGISGSLNLSSLSNVPGAPRGISANVSVAADGILDYLKGKHEFRNSMTLAVGVTRSASDEIWVKTNDILRLQTAYYYTVTPWFGPFAEITFQTSLFPLVIRRPSDTTRFCLGGSLGECTDGTTTDVIVTDRFDATGAFQPITLNERFGVFLRPVDSTYFRLGARFGFGAQQYFVKSDSWIETNRNAAGDHVTVDPLNPYGIFGAMADLQIRGAAKSEGLLYGANAALLMPFVDTRKAELRENDISPLQLDFSAFVTLKISHWASVDFRAAAARVPQVTGNDWQTSLNALLTFSYALVGDLDAARDSATTLRYEDFEGASGSLDVAD